MAADGNGRYCWLDPFEGARLAVAEACRNVVASGAAPIGATNCLNFGNPEKPEVMGQLVRAIHGIGDACRALGVPITGGNVSLYNETDGEAIYPTPVIGVVGLLEDASRVAAAWFEDEGDAVYLLGETGADLGGSEFLKVVHGRVAGPSAAARPRGREAPARRSCWTRRPPACCAPPTTSATAAWRWPWPSAASAARSRASAAASTCPARSGPTCCSSRNRPRA